VVAVAVTIYGSFVVPNFPASSKDILIYRNSIICLTFIILVLPGAFILSPSIRNKIPLFKEGKVASTIFGWGLLVVIGVFVSKGMYSFHSTVYNNDS